MSGSKERHGGVRVDHTRQIPRLRRIEGQVRGLQQMIKDGRHCIDVARQIEAVIAALRRVQGDMLRDHLRAIVEATVTGDLPETERQRLADEVADLMTKVI
jgi:DNA-binding FrmR family transcriptional regulator